MCMRVIAIDQQASAACMNNTVDREIFAVKTFSPVERVAKIKRAKNYFALYLQCKSESRWRKLNALKNMNIKRSKNFPIYSILVCFSYYGMCATHIIQKQCG